MPKGTSEKSDGKQSRVRFGFFVCKFVQFQCGIFLLFICGYYEMVNGSCQFYCRILIRCYFLFLKCFSKSSSYFYCE